MSRGAKQVIYVVIAAILLAVIGGSVYRAVINTVPSCFDNQKNQSETEVDCGGECIPCAIKALEPLTALDAAVFRDDYRLTVFFQAQNSNLGYGSDYFRYRIDLRDGNGKVVQTVTNSSFIYPNETKHLVEVGIEDRDRTIQSAQVTISDVTWKPAAEWIRPNITVDTITNTRNGDQFVFSGVIKNPNNFSVSKVILTVGLLNAKRQRIGVSKTELENLMPFETRPFQIFSIAPGANPDDVSLPETQLFIAAKK